jgi:RNA polymerase sigma factor (sigma-70 family)
VIAIDNPELLARAFEVHRPRMRAIAYRMLGSLSEADDAVQDAWLRLSRASVKEIEHLEAWLTTVIARVCLDALRARRSRREVTAECLPEPIVSPEAGLDPEQAALLGDAVGLALQVVLDTLGPDERLALILHDVFGVPFDEIGRMLDRTPGSARQLASRARRRVRGAPIPDADLRRQRAVVDAFYSAVNAADFAALVAILDPDVVVQSDVGAALGGLIAVRGAEAAARAVLNFARFARYARPALVNGAAGIIARDGDRTYAIVGFVVRNDQIAAIDFFADPDRLRSLDLSGVVD